MLNSLTSIFATIGAAVLAVMAALFVGRKQGKDDAKRREAESYIETRKEIDNADIGLGASDSERIKRLRELAGE